MITGSVDVLNLPSTLGGWAYDSSNPFGPSLIVEALLDDTIVGCCEAKYFRPDLAKLGNGYYAYAIECSHEIKASDIFNKRLKIRACSDSECQEITVSDSIGESVDIDSALSVMLSLKDDVLLKSIKKVINLRSPDTLDLPSKVFLPVGLQSIDGTSTLGKNGFIFLTGGTNGPIQLYSANPNDAAVINCIQDWISIIRTRSEWCQKHSIDYRQIIIPEKISVYPEQLHTPLLTPTRYLFGLEENLTANKFSRGYYVSSLEILKQAKRYGDVFGRTGTHLTPLGTFKLVQALLTSLSLHLDDIEFTEIELRKGELGDRFFGVHCYEEVKLPRKDTLTLHDPVVLSTDQPKFGKHLGTQRSWLCEEAPFQKKVLAFANSFFSVGFEQSEISWWFSRLFRNFHFVWAPHFDYQLIEKIQPDIIIGQSIERYIWQPPLDKKL